MTFGQFISILRVRWWQALLVLVLTVLGTLTVNLLLPKQYVASASVVVDAKPDPVSAMLYAGTMMPSYIATQVDVVQSDRVARRVVRNLQLTDNPQVRRQWQEATNGEGTIEGWLVETFQKNMEVKPARESNVITVSYRAADPRFAAGVANAFAQAYIETSLELRVDPAKQYSNFFDVRSKEAREVLEQAQTRLSAYQKQEGIIVTDERLDVENMRLNELSSQLVALQALASEAGSRQAQAGGSSGDKIAEVLNNPVIVSMKADLSRAQARLQELSSRLGDRHPQVQEAKASIEELNSRINAETRRITGGVAVSNNITRQRESEMRASLEAQRNKVLRMKSVRDEGAVLVRDVENAQRAYDVVMTRLNQSALESQTTQSNVYMLTTATAPARPAGPRILLNTMLSFFVGLLLAIAVALLVEQLDRRVRGVDEVAGALGLPVLGIMPGPAARRLFRSAKPLSMMQRRLLGHTPAGRNA